MSLDGKPVYILGLSAWYHDSAACLLMDGEIIAAAQEERFTRIRHDPAFPKNAVKFCLDFAGIDAGDLVVVAFYEKTFLKFERLLETYNAFAPAGAASFRVSMPAWLKERLFTRSRIKKEIESLGMGRLSARLLFPEHHASHAASAFFPSPFRDASILTVDGVGEYATTVIGCGDVNRISLLRKIDFPHSLGLLYSSFTHHLGFKVNSGEYKVMGLAPYGEPRYERLIKDRLVKIAEDGSFRLNMKYFTYCAGLQMTGGAFEELFGRKRRVPESPLSQDDLDMAASVQRVTEEIMMKMAVSAHRETGCKRLVMAGGVALNCVANGRLLREGPFEDIWIQPAAGDAGGAVGAALAAWHVHMGEGREPAAAGADGMKGAFLGPEFSDNEVERSLGKAGLKGRFLGGEKVVSAAAEAIAQGKVAGWMQGRMEFGPRALGARSILGDARVFGMRDRLNLKIKFREAFRPFAPSVLEESAADYFSGGSGSPYMLLTDYVKEGGRCALTSEQKAARGLDRKKFPHSDIPAVTHVDYSARVHTVGLEAQPRFRALLERLRETTGHGIVINTSFNVRGEPIVCTPEDAIACYLRTGMDCLFIGGWMAEKPAS